MVIVAFRQSQLRLAHAGKSVQPKFVLLSHQGFVSGEIKSVSRNDRDLRACGRF